MRPRPVRPSVVLLAVLTLTQAVAGQCEAPVAAEPMPRAAESLLLDIAQAGTRLVAVGERGHVLYSDDDGRHWVQAVVPTRAMLTAVWFADPQRGWAVGHDAVIINTADGGTSWSLQRNGLLAQRELDRRAVEEARARVTELAARVSSTEDEKLAMQLDEAGLDLEDAEATLAEPVFAPPLFDVRFGDVLRGLAIGAFGSCLLTSDGGQSWIDARAALGDPEHHHLYAIAALAGEELLVVGEAGQAFHSRDGGASWQGRSTGHAGTLFGVIAAMPAVYAFGLQGAVLQSSDAGLSWTALPSGTRAVLGGGLLGRDGAVWIAGSMGTLLRVVDGRIETRAGSARRSNLSGLVQTADGTLIAVGQGGIERLDDGAGEH